jgi:two-component system NtrC family sensor kinase
MAQELHSPLSAMAAFADLVLQESGSSGPQESAGVIKAEATRAGRIVGTVLDFAEQRARVREPVDVDDVLNRVIALQRSSLARARVRVIKNVPDRLPRVIGDPQELHQIVLNGVVNARQAIEATGRRGEITISARPTDSVMLVEIEDTGAGLAPDAVTHAFEPFFTTKGDSGSGLGLAISYGLVRAMGGRMWIENVSQKGARLSFEIPIELNVPARAAAPGPVAPAPIRLLVVENDENVRRGLTLLAKRLGHEVASVSSFSEASRRLADPAARFDVILVDVHLDDGHSGFDLFDQLRNEGEGREQKLVFTSGDSISFGTVSQLEQSGRPVLRKPFGMDELSATLARLANA